MQLIQLSKIEGVRFNEDTGTETESTKPVLVNADAIRCFYARRDGKAGTRLTFTDGGGFAVSEAVHEIAGILGADEIVGRLMLAQQPAQLAQVS